MSGRLRTRAAFRRRAAFALALWSWFAAGAPGAADPAERTSTLADQRGVSVTIYNGGVALVHDRRRLVFEKGRGRLAWSDVSAMFDPASAVVRSLSGAGLLEVFERNFDAGLLSPASLLAKYVGRDVTVVHDVPRPGRPARELARVLASNDGIVLRYADRIETDLTGSHLEYPVVASELRDRPTLFLDLSSARPGAQDVDLAYFSGGLSWQAEYVGVVSADKTRLDLNALVTLANTSGTAFRDARFELVAGNVNANVVEPAQPQGLMKALPIRAAAPLQQENFFEYHLYSLAGPTSLENGQSKQVELLRARAVPIRETLELRGADSYYSNATADLGDKLPVGAYVSFANKGGDLGIPLPGGVVRLYASDAGGTLQFLGSDRIDHTPRNGDVRLHVGDSFDVTADKKQTEFQTVGSCSYESSYELRLSNAKDDAQRVEVIEPVPGAWAILAESAPHRKTSSSTATWSLLVPANGTTTLSYRVRAKVCT